MIVGESEYTFTAHAREWVCDLCILQLWPLRNFKRSLSDSLIVHEENSKDNTYLINVVTADTDFSSFAWTSTSIFSAKFDNIGKIVLKQGYLNAFVW